MLKSRTLVDLQWGASETVLSQSPPPLAKFGFLHWCVKISNEISAGIFTVGNWKDGYISMVEKAVSH